MSRSKIKTNSIDFTSASTPTNAQTGHLWYDTNASALKSYNGSDWIKVSATVAILSSISGNIYAGVATTLTLTGDGFLNTNLTVNFTQSSDSIDVDVAVTPTSETSATVTVPSSVYSNVTSGNTVSINVQNDDGSRSSTLTKTCLSAPSGGSISTSGDYRIHTFTSSGSFVVPSGVSLTDVEYVVVAGGGSGGAAGPNRYYGGGGGGGAGGYRSSVSGESSGGGSSAESALTLSAGTYTVTIGGGGAAHSSSPSRYGASGSNTVFGSITSIGGGAAGTGCDETLSPLEYDGKSGGSGGGGFRDPISYGQAGSGTSGQGYAGNVGYDSIGGSGGGAGGTPAAATTLANIAGGNGVNSSITGSSVGRAGGGSGGCGHSPSQTPTRVTTGGGHDYGGGIPAPRENTSNTSCAGSVNTGGGGGGSSGSATAATTTYGGNGGSGIVIVRYQL